MAAMMTYIKFLRLNALLLLAFSCMPFTSLAEQATELSRQSNSPVQTERVGVLGGLYGNVSLKRDGSEIWLTGGNNIQVGDRIRAQSDQLFQLILRDETTFTFGGGADVTLDVFDYDEATGVGELQITQHAGLMKFATGRIANGQAGVFRIHQPHTDIAVLGTMGVLGVLTPEQVTQYFPQISLPDSSGAISYSALMGPGQRTSRVAKSGAFEVSSSGKKALINRPGGSVLANANSGPIVFVAPPLAISRSLIANEEEDSSSSAGDHSMPDSKANKASGALSSSLPSLTAESMQNIKLDNSNNAQENRALLRDVQSLINKESIQDALDNLQQTLILPEENQMPSNSPAPGTPTSSTQDSATPDENSGILDPLPIDPLPIDPNPIDPIIDPIAPGIAPGIAPEIDPGIDPGGIVCPGDPTCP